MLQSHYRNYGEHNDYQYLTQNCQNLVHKFLSVTLRNFRQGIFPKSWQYFNHYISPFVGYWQRLENQEISLVKAIDSLTLHLKKRLTK